ncbi:MAG TPA: hypothetical protein VGI39_08595 [Polyangiaceae bacterium]|jgi:hypothetical protein
MSARSRTSASKTKTVHVSNTNNNANPASPNPIVSPVGVTQKPPPPDAFNLVPPLGFVAPNNSIYKGALPWLIEATALSGALQDLANFADYSSALGPTVPELTLLVAGCTLADQWTRARKVSVAWDGYAKIQEGLAWLALRALLDKLRPGYLLAVQYDPSIATRFANLNALMGAKKAVAKRGASTRALNAQAKAEGKPPIHGKAGKQRKKAADKAIVAAATAAPTVTPPPVPTTAPTTPAAPPPATTSPVATTAPALPHS